MGAGGVAVWWCAGVCGGALRRACPLSGAARSWAPGLVHQLVPHQPQCWLPTCACWLLLPTHCCPLTMTALQACERPDVVEVWDVTSADPKLLVFLKVGPWVGLLARRCRPLPDACCATPWGPRPRPPPPAAWR